MLLSLLSYSHYVHFEIALFFIKSSRWDLTIYVFFTDLYFILMTYVCYALKVANLLVSSIIKGVNFSFLSVLEK